MDDWVGMTVMQRFAVTLDRIIELPWDAVDENDTSGSSHGTPSLPGKDRRRNKWGTVPIFAQRKWDCPLVAGPNMISTRQYKRQDTAVQAVPLSRPKGQ